MLRAPTAAPERNTNRSMARIRGSCQPWRSAASMTSVFTEAGEGYQNRIAVAFLHGRRLLPGHIPGVDDRGGRSIDLIAGLGADQISADDDSHRRARHGDPAPERRLQHDRPNGRPGPLFDTVEDTGIKAGAGLHAGAESAEH